METLFKKDIVITGDFSEHADVVLRCGDCLEFLRAIPDKTITLIVSSPPYNIGKEYEKKTAIEEYLSKQKPVIAELYRILKDEGSLCWEVGNFVDKGEVYPLDIYYYPIFKELGLHLRNRIIWHFGHGLHASKRFSGRYESIIWFTKSGKYKFNLDSIRVPSKYPGKRHFKGTLKGKPSCNPLGKNPSDMWEVIKNDWENEIWNIPNVKSNHPEKTIHPCQFPIELVERCVLALTDKKDWVLDPYAGVGSTLVAAIKNDRKAAGCDKESDYVKVTQSRIQKFLAGELRTRPIGKPIFAPTGKEKASQIPDEWKQEKNHANSGDLFL
jgi:adenine-specific DNA-methyltransferase